MKNVVKKSRYYNVILSSDDGATKAIRIKRITIRILVFLFIGLLLIGSSGIGVGIHYLRQTAEYRANKQELAAAKAELGKLSNYDKLALVSTAPTPIAKNEEIGSGPDTHQTETPNEESDRPLADNSQSTGLGVELVQRNSTNATSASGIAISANSTSEQPSAAENSDVPFRISNFFVRVLGQSRIRLHYDFFAVPQDRAIRGSVQYTALLSNGNSFDFTPTSSDETTFTVSRTKAFDFVFRLPEDVLPRQIKAFIITVATDNTTYQQQFTPDW